MAQSSSVQAHATKRNALVELFIDLALDEFAQCLLSEGLVTEVDGPELGVAFVADDCSDVFDHKLAVQERCGDSVLGLEIWGQTTCYKGHASAIRESNKTYEIRETLIEALGLRRNLREKGTRFLTVHFTIGPSGYTYEWFEAAKKASFDFSVYIPHPSSGPSLFDLLEAISGDSSNDLDIKTSFRNQLHAQSEFKAVFAALVERLTHWFRATDRQNKLADAQAELLQTLRDQRNGKVATLVSSGNVIGANIKSRALNLLQGGDCNDPALTIAVSRTLNSNPFLQAAYEALASWEIWMARHSPANLSAVTLTDYMTSLWVTGQPERLVLRRILLRAASDEKTLYPADVNVGGITEHNLYVGDHSPQQVRTIVESILARFMEAQIIDATSLYARILAHGPKLIRASQSNEKVNGTNLKPSFYYIEEFLKPEFYVGKFQHFNLPAPIGYQSTFSTATVKQYENLKVVAASGQDRPLAILKGKYFRQPEFARRAKEEAYVGLTLLHVLSEGGFRERYPGIPLLMFIDMDLKCRVLEYSVRRLITSGWDVFFCPTALKNYLRQRA